MNRALALAAAGMMAVTVPAVTFPSIASAQSYDPCRDQQRQSANKGTIVGGLVGALAGGGVAAKGAKTEGALLGGAVGAVAGHEISDHTGGSRGNKNIAAAAGAVGGALAGNQIQKNVTSDTYDLSVRMDDGRTVVINQRDLGGIRENTYVRVVNGKVVLR